MKKILTFLCLSALSFPLSFASDLSSDDQTNLTALQLRASHYFEVGNLEQERLARIKILKVCRDFESLRLAIHVNIVCKKFDVAETLLNDHCPYIDNSESKFLRRYIQDEKIKHEEWMLNQQNQRQKNALLKLLSIFKRSR